MRQSPGGNQLVFLVWEFKTGFHRDAYPVSRASHSPIGGVFVWDIGNSVFTEGDTVKLIDKKAFFML